MFCFNCNIEAWVFIATWSFNLQRIQFEVSIRHSVPNFGINMKFRASMAAASFKLRRQYEVHVRVQWQLKASNFEYITKPLTSMPVPVSSFEYITKSLSSMAASSFECNVGTRASTESFSLKLWWQPTVEGWVRVEWGQRGKVRAEWAVHSICLL